MKTFTFYMQLYEILKGKTLPNCHGKLSWQRAQSAQCKYANSFTNEEMGSGLGACRSFISDKAKARGLGAPVHGDAPRPHPESPTRSAMLTPLYTRVSAGGRDATMPTWVPKAGLLL